MECKWLPDYFAEPDWNDYRSFEDNLYKLFKQMFLTV